MMPLISLITGKVSFEQMKWVVGQTEIPYGMFLQAIFNFLAVAVCIFFLVKLINRLTALGKKKEAEEAPTEPARLCPFCFSEIHKDATRCPHCTSELPVETKH